MTEDAFRTELRRTHQYIFNSSEGELLRQVLADSCNGMKTAYILHWTPDQGADFYTVLVDGHSIISVEIEKDITKKWFKRTLVQKVVSVNRFSLNEYKYELSKMNQIRLEVAIDLSNRDQE